MKVYLYLLLIFSNDYQEMNIDYDFLDRSITELFQGLEYIECNNENFTECYFPASNYSTISGTPTNYNFLGFPVQKIGAYVNTENELKKLTLSVKVPNGRLFYDKVVKKYGMPETSSLSQFYLEKYGYKTPMEIEKDSWNESYENINKPKMEDLSIIKSSNWYGINEGSGRTSIGMVIKNKTNPQNLFSEKEIWITFIREKY
ncbi:hypothetical protein [Maribacter sp. MAR_2009_72]|uniref:hypothetical protein n=1 Tax=Maribacter sp. MAR_2009_72 TaxID=1250050 RepID=UPI00119AD0BB|nr:hypothetical protein [Maribacter sp. MAR_2009_72]TVZ16482.1 hypothetical protein JM81_2743 [Maribacter sp. MAR_2009_72]